ncbi:hypothetical protein BDZ45DRAFT_748410 [Acephala macrosclerotiorum]|nr:hypothetical protein BDZ45DRAFT_748410 [Acephala macrosclerotiorum]
MAASTNVQALVPLSVCAQFHLEFIQSMYPSHAALEAGGAILQTATPLTVSNCSTSWSKGAEATEWVGTFSSNTSMAHYKALVANMISPDPEALYRTEPKDHPTCPSHQSSYRLPPINSKLRREYELYGFLTIKRNSSKGLIDIIFHPNVDLLYYLHSGPYLNTLWNIENALTASRVFDRIRFLAFDVFDTSPILALLNSHNLPNLELVIMNISDDGLLHKQQSKTHNCNPISQMRVSWFVYFGEGEQLKRIQLSNVPKVYQGRVVKDLRRATPQVIMVEWRRAA